MHFLDVTTFKGPDFNTTGRLDTKVFFKPTDSHALLHYSSFHPKHTFTGIIKSQLIRFKRICSRPEDNMLAIQTLFKALSKRGYSRSLLRTVRKNINNTRTSAQKDRFKNKRMVPFVAAYSPYTTRAIRRAKKHFEDTMTGTSLAQNMEIIPAYKRNPNLRDILVRAKLPRPSVRPGSPGRCRTAQIPLPKTPTWFKGISPWNIATASIKSIADAAKKSTWERPGIACRLVFPHTSITSVPEKNLTLSWYSTSRPMAYRTYNYKAYSTTPTGRREKGKEWSITGSKNWGHGTRKASTKIDRDQFRLIFPCIYFDLCFWVCVPTFVQRPCSYHCLESNIATSDIHFTPFYDTIKLTLEDKPAPPLHLQQ